MSIGERLRELKKITHLSQKEFAELLGVSPTTYAAYFNDERKFNTEVLERIVANYPNFNVSWLLFGRGEMFIAASNAQNQINTYGQGNSKGTVNSGAGAIITGNRSGVAGQEQKIEKLEAELRQVNMELVIKKNEVDLLNKHITNLERSLENCQKLLEIRRDMEK